MPRHKCLLGGRPSRSSRRRKLENQVSERKIWPSRLVAVSLSCAVVLASQLYFAYNPSFGTMTLLFGVLLPLLVGGVLLFVTDQMAILLGFIGIFWSIVDDAPISFDSFLTWPQVTRTSPFLPHLEMEILLHILTLGFLMGSIWMRLRNKNPRERAGSWPYLAALVAAILCYVQNVPLPLVQDYVVQSWYQLDAVEHALSVFSFAVALQLSRGGQK